MKKILFFIFIFGVFSAGSLKAQDEDLVFDPRAYWHFACALYAQALQDEGRATVEFDQAAVMTPPPRPFTTGWHPTITSRGWNIKPRKSFRNPSSWNRITFQPAFYWPTFSPLRMNTAKRRRNTTRFLKWILPILKPSII